MSRLRSLALNTFSNISITVVSALVNLAIIPVFIGAYGKELYGVYLLAMGFTGILFSFDLGTSRGLTRFAAEFSANRNSERFSKAVSINFVLLLIFGSVSAGILIGMSEVLPVMFDVNAELRDQSAQIFKLIGFLIFFTWLSKLPAGILEGFQCYYIKNMFEALSITVNVILALLIIKTDLSLLTYIKVTIATKFVVDMLGAYYIFSRKLISGVRLDLKSLHLDDVKSEFAKYSLSLFILQMASMLMFQADKIIVGSLLSVSSVTVYHVISRPMYLLRTVNNIILSAICPVISKENERGDQVFVKKLIFTVSKVHFLVLVPVTLLLMVHMKVLFYYWLPTEYISYTSWAALFCSVYLVTPLFGAIYTALVSVGKMKELVKFNISASIFNCICSVVLVMQFGVPGAVLATIFQFLISAVYYSQLGVRLLQFNFTEFLSYSFSRNLVLLLVLLFSNILLSTQLNMLVLWNIIIGIVVNIALYALITCTVVLSHDEKQQILRTVRVRTF